MPLITKRVFPDARPVPDSKAMADAAQQDVHSAAASPIIDRTDPAGAIAEAAKRCSNAGRWGCDDVLGTLNFIDAAKRVEGASLVRRGVSFSLAQSFDENGPQHGWRKRTNPVHTMLSSGLDAEFGPADFPHGLGGADDVIFMPLQASTQWDGLGHVFDHGQAYNGRRASKVVTSDGDLVTGIETAADRIAGRGVLLDVGRAIGTGGELPDGFAITAEHLAQTIAAQGVSARVGRGDLLLVRTGQLARARRDGWGQYAGGPAPGLSFTTAGWLHSTEIAGIATDTWGFEVRPNEFDVAFQPLHQVSIPHIGLFIGEMWDPDALAADCAADGVYEFLLVAAPIPVTGAVGAPVNPIAIK
jgi:kynurenine formamidase